MHFWLRHGKTWPPGSTAPQVPSIGDTQLHPSSCCPPPTRPARVSSRPGFLSPDSPQAHVLAVVFTSAFLLGQFLNVILNDIVAQAIVTSCHVQCTLGGAHHTPLASETLTRAAHPSGDPLMLMLPTPCYRRRALRLTGLSFFTLTSVGPFYR